jgi:hypothetical protein
MCCFVHCVSSTAHHGVALQVALCVAKVHLDIEDDTEMRIRQKVMEMLDEEERKDAAAAAEAPTTSGDTAMPSAGAGSGLSGPAPGPSSPCRTWTLLGVLLCNVPTKAPAGRAHSSICWALRGLLLQETCCAGRFWRKTSTCRYSCHFRGWHLFGLNLRGC